MNMFLEIWFAWLAITTIPLIVFFIIGLRRIRGGLGIPCPPENDLARPPIEILVPTPEPRDPVPDATGSEGVTPALSRTILRILIRRPGGSE